MSFKRLRKKNIKDSEDFAVWALYGAVLTGLIYSFVHLINELIY